MCLIWGLVSRNRRWFWLTVAQLAVFHVISASQIGYFYPLLMFCILALYPLSRLIPPPTETAGHWIPLDRPGRVFIAFFAFLQIYPSLASWAQSKDRAFTGVGRTFALNMFEGNFGCDVRWIEHRRDGRLTEINIKDPTTKRLECEPIYYYSKTKNRCRSLALNPGLVDLDLQMRINRIGDPEMRSIIDQRSFCSHPPTYNLFLPNAWIGKKL
jgi:hypothetical protein